MRYAKEKRNNRPKRGFSAMRLLDMPFRLAPNSLLAQWLARTGSQNSFRIQIGYRGGAPLRSAHLSRIDQ